MGKEWYVLLQQMLSILAGRFNGFGCCRDFQKVIHAGDDKIAVTTVALPWMSKSGHSYGPRLVITVDVRYVHKHANISTSSMNSVSRPLQEVRVDLLFCSKDATEKSETIS